MNEEELSLALFRAANADPSLTILSWQAVDGKGYFTADVKLRLSNRQRVEPDLVLCDSCRVWLIELKSTHLGALEDEHKLVNALHDLGTVEIVSQIQRRVMNHPVPNELVLVVAYAENNVNAGTDCEESVLHMYWPEVVQRVGEYGLSSILFQLSQP